MKSSPTYFRVISKVMIFALLALVAFQPDPAVAKIYKYKDEHGKTHFTDDASSIPMRYRKKGSMKKFRGVAEPTPSVRASSGSSGDKIKGKDDKILSSQDVGLIKKTIQVFGVGVKLGERYKNTMPNFPNGQGAINAIQSALPMKEALASELEGAKAPELKAALGFLKQSISVDRETTGIGAGLTTRIAGILNRLVSEGEQQAAMIKNLEKALKDSDKRKEEAKKKKEEEEAKKAKEEAEAAKKKKEEEAKRIAEETESKIKNIEEIKEKEPSKESLELE